jgi:hypothetical protein
MTHIDNIVSILNNGLLSHANSKVSVDISNQEVNDRRARKEPIYHKSIHSYVPFYINPKNAMLYCRRDIQDDIVILAYNKDLITKSGAIFTDGNASSNATKFYRHIKDLDRLYWNVLDASSWYDKIDGKRRRMAEVLVPQKVKTNRLQTIICNSYSTYNKLCDIVNDSIEVVVDHSFYF